MSADPQSAYEVLSLVPRPVLVLRAGRVFFANSAYLAADGRPLSELLGASLGELIEGEPRSGAKDPDTWGRLLGPAKKGQWVRLWRSSRPEHEEETILVEEAAEELQALRLSDGLVRVTAQLLVSRDEDEILRLACDALLEQGFFVSLFQIEGDSFFFREVRNLPELVEAADTTYGHPLRDRRIPLSGISLIPELFGERRAVFTEDVYPLANVISGPELVRVLKMRYPEMKGLSAPIFVEAEPWGFLAIFAVALSPECASVLSLFSQQLGAALENVRHHATAREQLAKVHSLQQDLVAQERFAVLGEAAGMLAHEVRNPLAVIGNGISLLRRDAATSGSEGSRATLKMIDEELARLDSLVHDVLTAARPVEVRRERTDLVALLRTAAEALRADAGSVRIEVSSSIEEAPTLADASQLQLALGKLVQNALQASPAGGTVRLTLGRRGDMWVLQVEDEGPGLQPHVAARLFRPFFTTRTEGTGLGLTVALSVARAHGGSVQAAPREPRGSLFELLLPVLGSSKENSGES